LSDSLPDLIVYSTTSKDNLRVIPFALGAMGQIIGVHSDAVAADETRREREEIPFGSGGGEHVSDEAGIITARWQDETLHFDYLYNPATDRQSERTEDWTLSPDLREAEPAKPVRSAQA